MIEDGPTLSNVVQAKRVSFLSDKSRHTGDLPLGKVMGVVRHDTRSPILVSCPIVPACDAVERLLRLGKLCTLQIRLPQNVVYGGAYRFVHSIDVAR